jgi:hypothetical protein
VGWGEYPVNNKRKLMAADEPSFCVVYCLPLLRRFLMGGIYNQQQRQPIDESDFFPSRPGNFCVSCPTAGGVYTLDSLSLKLLKVIL